MMTMPGRSPETVLRDYIDDLQAMQRATKEAVATLGGIAISKRPQRLSTLHVVDDMPEIDALGRSNTSVVERRLLPWANDLVDWYEARQEQEPALPDIPGNSGEEIARVFERSLLNG